MHTHLSCLVDVDKWAVRWGGGGRGTSLERLTVYQMWADLNFYGGFCRHFSETHAKLALKLPGSLLKYLLKPANRSSLSSGSQASLPHDQ